MGGRYWERGGERDKEREIEWDKEKKRLSEISRKKEIQWEEDIERETERDRERLGG